MHKKCTTTSRTAALLMIFAVPPATAEVDASMISNTCAGCHGTNGVSEGAAPSIAGLSEEYLKATMLTYKDGTRYSTIMGRIARGYTEAEIDAMAKFFAQRPWQAAEQETDPTLVAKGETLHGEKFCGGCHGAAGEMSNDTTPALAGQYAGYLYFQMLDIANPDTPLPPASQVMRPLLGDLNDEDIKALAHFYASQQ